jgi:hypothetical protein
MDVSSTFAWSQGIIICSKIRAEILLDEDTIIKSIKHLTTYDKISILKDLKDYCVFEFLEEDNEIRKGVL